MVQFERAMVVSYGLSVVTTPLFLTIWPQFAIECLRQSTGSGSFWDQILREGVNRCKPNFNTTWDRHGLSYAKEIVSISSAV